MAHSPKSVLVTGASGGVGQAIVAKLDRLGWRVFAGVRSPAAGEQLAHDHPNVVPVELDVCDEASIVSARDAITAVLGDSGLNALVNNAGLSVDGPLELIPVVRLRQQFEVNVIGQIALAQAFLPLLRQGNGRIVNVGGAAGRMALPMRGALSASKAALDVASDALRMELKYQNVAVCYVEPGALNTDLFAKSARIVERDGFAGSVRQRARYERAIARSAQAMAAQKPTPVDHAATVICTALTARRPRARYPVGRDARVVLPLLRKLPVRMRDRLVMSSLGLTKDAFATPAIGTSGESSLRGAR